MEVILLALKRSLVMLYNVCVRPRVLSSLVHPRAQIGKNTKVHLNTAIDQNCVIGNYTYIGRNTDVTKSEIGNYCSIANGVKIGQGEHDLKNFSTSVRFTKDPYNDLLQEPCTLGHDVWVGANAVILRGVTVGTGAVVGANAVVTKDVAPYSVVVGVPAREIRKRFCPAQIETLLESKWWEFSNADAMKFGQKFKDND
ncbi:MAG: chloramphenicol acetyltransferase [Roseivirga sp. XM-24bin3]|nr:CatB-related O-acetyltransferase [uncultured Roseivirga sp.]PWL30932.1 MAG: chloramphenicol acetyltransferase [Roseivirga sp. XM-24bin3]